MKYILKKETPLDYANSFFDVVNQYPNISLIGTDNSIIYEGFECFVKFTVTSENQMIFGSDIGSLKNECICLDGKILTRDDIHNIAQEKTFENIEDNLKLHYKDAFLSSRICYPFTTEDIGTQHIFAFTANSPINLYGKCDEISVINNFANYLTTLTSSNLNNNFKLYIAKISDNELQNFQTLMGSNSMNNIPNSTWEMFKVPTNLSKLPNSSFRKVDINKCNFYDLINLEEIGDEVFSYEMSSETQNIDLSAMTKLKKIGGTCFCGIHINSLILPPNIEYVGEYTFKNCVFNDGCIIEIPQSIKMFDYVFHQCEGEIIVKFKSSIPPTIKNTEVNKSELDNITLSYFGNTLINYGLSGSPKIKIMIPRGSLRAYFNAMFDPDNYDVYKEMSWFANIIEYDPE